MNNLFQFFDYFFLKAQADIVVYNWKRKVGVTPKNATQNHFTTGQLLIFS